MFGCVVVVAAGQVLFKSVGLRLGSKGFEALLTDYVAASLMLLALTLYGISTLGWVLALRQVPLSTAYLFMSLSFLIVPALASVFLGETISTKTFLGGGLIVAGILVASTEST
ncbi:MAG: EamA family transporter [Gammaproteobacteria bacterium]|nr:EamA family transporter [Gammaproteobacteria bacterium]